MDVDPALQAEFDSGGSLILHPATAAALPQDTSGSSRQSSGGLVVRVHIPNNQPAVAGAVDEIESLSTIDTGDTSLLLL